MRFRAKSSFIPPGEGGLLSVPLSRLSGRRNSYFKVALLLLAGWFFVWTYKTVTGSHYSLSSGHKYPEPHPPGAKYITKTNLRYIYPQIEDVPALKNLGIYSLFVRLDGALISMNFFDDEDPKKEAAKEKALNLELDETRVKNNFKNSRKIVFDSTSSSNSPKVVVVSMIDYDKYSLKSIVDIVQNRVDYAIKNEYGVYIRWTQEFVPELNDFEFPSKRELAKWARLACLRAAMFAFPHAEWFWFLTEDALIMNKEVDLIDYLLAPSSLETVMMRDAPLIPPLGIIRTYTNTDPENVKLIFTQSTQKIETNSFVIRNDMISRSILELWQDKLYMQYSNFPFGPDSAITHILQWHPYLLAKTALVPARMISSMHNPLVTEDQRDSDLLNYYPGDLAAHWIDCNSPESCDALLSECMELLQKD